MEMLSGAQMVVRALGRSGELSTWPGYPGGSVLDIYDALFENGKMEHVLVRARAGRGTHGGRLRLLHRQRWALCW